MKKISGKPENILARTTAISILMLKTYLTSGAVQN